MKSNENRWKIIYEKEQGLVNIAIYGGVQNIPLFARKTCDEVIQGWAAAIYEFGFQKPVNMQLFRKYYAPGGKIPAKLHFFLWLVLNLREVM